MKMSRKMHRAAARTGAATGILICALVLCSLRCVPGETPGSSTGFEGALRGDAGKANGDTRLIVDTDMGLDDARALFVLAGAPGIDLEIVMTVEGAAAAGTGAGNAIALLETAGLDDVRVLRGRSYPALDPPPWRAMAESLGGVAFPPPRILSQDPLDKDAHSSVANELPGATVLALGPLGNLARIEWLRAGALREARVMIPARLDGMVLGGWNLERDREAAATVFDKAGEIVLVDAGAAVDEQRIICGIAGETPAARWILATVCSGDNAHLFLHDEIAAAAAVSPGLFEIGPERYSVSLREGALVLSPDPDGPVRIARLRDPGAFEAFIHACWETPAPPSRRHPPAPCDRR